jgi:hypothetical protein
MQKRTKLALAVAILAALITAIVLFAHRSEPHYHGQPLAYWLGECVDNPYLARYVFALPSRAPQPPDTECVRAIRAIGTNAIPTLLAWISHERPPARPKPVSWLARLSGRFRRVHRWFVPEFRRSHAAALGFAILGDRSAPALPALANIANGTNMEAAQMAMYAMGRAGPAALPFLERILTNHAAIPRFLAARNLGGLGTNAMPALPTLLACVGDTDQEVAIAALWSLADVIPGERVIAPATDALNDSRPRVRVAALQALHTAGEKAAPFVESALNDPDDGVRHEARLILKALSAQNRTTVSRQ